MAKKIVKKTTLSRPLSKSQLNSGLKKLGVRLPHGYVLTKRKKK